MASSTQALAKKEPNQLARLQDDLNKLLPALNQALPATIKKYLTPERVVKVAMLAIRKSPLLAQCSRESILQCVMDASSLGLDVGGMLGHAYLVPFKNNKKGIYESQLIVGYKGLISLARRSGEVLSVKAEIVYDKDEFEVDLASGDLPKHKPYLRGDRGNAYLVYCVARFRDGGNHTEVMTLADCEKIRLRSKAKDAGPWSNRDDYLEMCKKTCARRASKYWPLSTDTASDVAAVAELEAKHEEVPINQDAGDVLDAVYSSAQAIEAPRSRTDEVLARISGDNPVTGETSWGEPGPEVSDPPEPPEPPASEDVLAFARTRWAELSPDHRADKDILAALRGINIRRTELSQCSEGEFKALFDWVQRPGAKQATP